MEEILLIGGIPIVALAGYAIYRQITVVQAARQSAAQQKTQLEVLRNQLAAQHQQIEKTNEQMAKADALILRLRQTIAKSDSQYAALKEQHEAQRQTLKQLKEQIKASEIESAQSKALFSTVSNVAYDLVFVLDESGTIIAANNSASHLFGETNPIGEKFRDVLNAPELESLVRRAIDEEESLEEQFTLKRRYYRSRTQVIHYQPDQFFIGIAVQDITQLVRLNRARRDMVANISHELRTPIANIRMIIDGLFHERSRPKRKASIASLRAIARESETLEWTVQELLDLSMIESGQAIMKLIDEPLIEVVDEAVDRLEEKLNRKNLNVVRHIPGKMRVLCDREHIRRVVMNLISNAIKWSPEDDTITISAINGSEEVTVNVFDNGPGVPDDQRERIFERFYQVDTSRSRGEGSGLGLAICKHIIEAHGGQIWAEGNSQGGGGRFMFTLLNASTDIEEVEMDRGQHDFNFKQSPTPNSENTEHADLPPEAEAIPEDGCEN